MTAPALGYPYINREFVLETNASLQGVGEILSQQDENGKLHVIPYARQSLHPSKRSMHNDSSANLELLHINGWSWKNFMTICQASRFHIYMDNSPGLCQREQTRCITNLVVEQTGLV